MRKSSCLLLFLFLISIPTILYWYFWQSTWLSGDSPAYLQAASEIANFSMPAPERVPLFPSLLALVGATSKSANFSWLLLVQLLMHGVVVCITTYVLLDLKIPKIPCISAAILLWLPPYTQYAGYVLSETLAEFLLAIMFFCVYQFFKTQGSFPLYIAAAISAALALVRTTFQALSLFLIPLLTCIIWYIPLINSRRKESLRMWVVFLTMFVLLVGGWYAHNYYKHNFFGLSVSSNFALCNKTVRAIDRLPESMSDVRDILIKYRNESFQPYPKDFIGVGFIQKALPELQRLQGKPELRFLSFCGRLTRRL